MFTEWEDSDCARETMRLIARTEEVVCVCELATTYASSAEEDFVAMQQLCHDELGDPDAIYSAGDVFEIVAVPDDVAGAFAGPDEISVTFGEEFDEAECQEVCDSVNRVTGDSSTLEDVE